MESKDYERIAVLEACQLNLEKVLNQKQQKLDKIDENLSQINKKLHNGINTTLANLSDTLKATVTLQNELHLQIVNNSFRIKMMTWFFGIITTGTVGTVIRLILT